MDPPAQPKKKRNQKHDMMTRGIYLRKSEVYLTAVLCTFQQVGQLGSDLLQEISCRGRGRTSLADLIFRCPDFELSSKNIRSMCTTTETGCLSLIIFTRREEV